MTAQIKAGVISDTHGFLRPRALSALTGVDHIIHAGDIGSREVIETLQQIAPLTVVRGNVDLGEWALEFPTTQILELGQVCVYILHDLHDLDLDPAGGYAAVVSGHSHTPSNEVRNGVLYFNPGSAGRRRFQLPITLGYLSIQGRSISGNILSLED